MKKVLMVSSSKAFISRNTKLLMDKDFLFFTASTGAETLKLHKDQWFDLIICDLEMEDMDGCTLCAEVHKADGSQIVPFVIICHDIEEHLQKVKQSDASAILLRPINPIHLLITIGSFIDMQLARSKRVEFKGVVLLKKPGLELVCNSHDISATGLRIESEQPLDLGSSIICQFELPGLCKIKANAEVIRNSNDSIANNKQVYGIRFVDLPVTNRSAIEKYIFTNNHLGIKLKPHRPLERSRYYQQASA